MAVNDENNNTNTNTTNNQSISSLSLSPLTIERQSKLINHGNARIRKRTADRHQQTSEDGRYSLPQLQQQQQQPCQNLSPPPSSVVRTPPTSRLSISVDYPVIQLSHDQKLRQRSLLQPKTKNNSPPRKQRQLTSSTSAFQKAAFFASQQKQRRQCKGGDSSIVGNDYGATTATNTNTVSGSGCDRVGEDLSSMIMAATESVIVRIEGDSENSDPTAPGSVDHPVPLDKSGEAAGSTASDRMKRLFAARRRRAQMEMQEENMSHKSRRESAGSLTTLGTLGSVGTTSSCQSMASQSTVSKSSLPRHPRTSAASVKHSSRRALDRYLGRRNRGSGSCFGNNSSLSSGSRESASSATAASGSGEGIGQSRSADDSLDSNTASSLAGRGIVATSDGNVGGVLLQSVNEESCRSLASLGTVRVSNMVDLDNYAGVKTAAHGTAVKDVTKKEGLLGHSLVEDKDASLVTRTEVLALSSESSEAAKDSILREHRLQPQQHCHTSNNEVTAVEKSVRFHMSPLESYARQKKEALRWRDRPLEKGATQDRTVREEEERGQCSPPRPPSSSPPERALCSFPSRQKPGGEHERHFDGSQGKERKTRTGPALRTGSSGRSKSAGSAAVEEDMEFTMFVVGLRREVAVDHTQLWSGFQSLLGRALPSQTPLHQSYVGDNHYDNSVQELDGKKHKKQKKKKEKVKMDPQTQKSLTTIHKHLMENGRVKAKFMTTTSQLMNDKKVKKDRASLTGRLSSRAREGREPSSTAGGGDESQCKHEDVDTSPSNSHSWRPANGPSARELRSQKKSYIKMAPLKDGRCNLGSSSSSSGNGNSNSVSVEVKFSSVKLRSVGPPINGGGSGNPRINGGATRSSLTGATKQRMSWMENLKKKQKNLRLKQLAQVDEQHGDNTDMITPPQNTANCDIDGNGNCVLFRSALVSPRKKSRVTPPSTPKEEQAAPWANVQLRSTPKKRNSMNPTLHSPMSGGGAGTLPSVGSVHSSLDETVPPIQANGSWGSSSSSTLSFLSTLSPSHEGSTHASKSLPPLCCVGDIIDLDALPKTLFTPEEGPPAVFSLRNKPSTKEPPKQQPLQQSSAKAYSDQQPSIVVIVGRTVILTAIAASGNPASVAHRPHTISWWCRRAEIRALTLNVEATGANLAHANGRTPLLFESADVCLDFAQAFYGRASRVVVSSAPALEERRGENGRSCADAEPTTFDRPPLNNGEGITDPKSILTEDEESLLDRYRRFSHSDRTRLQLTCLSPRGELQEMEVSLLQPSSMAATMTGFDGSDATRDAVSTAGGDDGTGGLITTLSDDEEKKALKYRKMIKMGIPLDAVRHKMTSDKTSPKIVTAVLSGGVKDNQNLPQESSKFSEKEEEVVSKFRKMIRMKIPLEAVRHKMTVEGVAPQIAEAVFKADAAAAPTIQDFTKGEKLQLSEEEDVIASKYRKMLKMGIPLGAVEHSMKKDGISPKIVSALAGKELPSLSSTHDSGLLSKSKKCTTLAVSALSDEEEEIASKYRTMLKVSIPKPAVQHKMRQEGVSLKIMEAVLGNDEKNKRNDRSLADGGSNNKPRKTIAFHWTASNLAPELLEQSIFGRAELKKRKIATINPEELDIKKLEELFQKRNAVVKGSASGNGDGGLDNGGNNMAKLLDLTRANNIAISLKAFNDFTFRSLAETIDDLDPDHKIVGERVHFVASLLPSPKEVLAIKKYKGEDNRLITAELFFRQLVSIKRIEDKVQVMRAISTFDELVEELRTSFKTLQRVCSQIMDSEKLILVLEMVLKVGNLMNAGSVNGGVEAFKFESLPKLSQTKSANGKMTILDYIVETFIKKEEKNVLLLMEEFPDIQTSSRLSIADLLGNIKTLQNDYNLCKLELKRMKRDQSSKRVTRSMSEKMKKESDKAAMFAAIKSRETSTNSDPRHALLAEIQKKKKDSTAAESTHQSSTLSDVKYSPGVYRLQKYLTHAKAMLSLAERDQDAALRACRGLAVYCGEEGGEQSAALLLQVLSDFALSLENGVKKYDIRVEAEKKKAAKKSKESVNNRVERNATPGQGKGSSTPSIVIKDRVPSIQGDHDSVPESFPVKKGEKIQPQVSVTDIVNGKTQIVQETDTTSDIVNRKTQIVQETDTMSALLSAIKDKGLLEKGNASLSSSFTNGKPTSVKSAKDSFSPTPSGGILSRAKHTNSKNGDPKQALLASIKKRRDSLSDSVKHANSAMGQKESHIMLVNRMLSEAPAGLKEDFLQGVTYEKTNNPLLRKIYEKEGPLKRKVLETS